MRSNHREGGTEGGTFVLRLPDGRINVQGKVAEYDPPHKLSVTWHVEWPEDFSKLPECLVTYEIAPAGEAVRLTMTESHSRKGARSDPFRRQDRLAGGAVRAEELAGNRQVACNCDGAAEGDDRGDQSAALISADWR